MGAGNVRFNTGKHGFKSVTPIILPVKLLNIIYQLPGYLVLNCQNEWKNKMETTKATLSEDDSLKAYQIFSLGNR